MPRELANLILIRRRGVVRRMGRRCIRKRDLLSFHGANLLRSHEARLPPCHPRRAHTHLLCSHEARVLSCHPFRALTRLLRPRAACLCPCRPHLVRAHLLRSHVACSYLRRPHRACTHLLHPRGAHSCLRSHGAHLRPCRPRPRSRLLHPHLFRPWQRRVSARCPSPNHYH